MHENTCVIHCSKTILTCPMMVQHSPKHFSLSTGTQPTRKVQWQDPIQTHSSDSEFLNQIPESFVSLNCSQRSPVPTRGLSCLHSLLYSAAQLVNVNSLKSVLLAQNLYLFQSFYSRQYHGCTSLFKLCN